MKTIITVVVTTPDGTEGVADAIAWALDNPMNYPDDADTQDWGVTVNDALDDAAEQVRQFLAEQLDRDDMTLAEIAAEATCIATGASEYEPADDDEDENYDTSSLAKEDARNAWQHRSPDGYPGDDQPPPWLSDPDRDDGEIKLAIEDEEN